VSTVKVDNDDGVWEYLLHSIVASTDEACILLRFFLCERTNSHDSLYEQVNIAQWGLLTPYERAEYPCLHDGLCLEVVSDGNINGR
jgi:hypothetical protein